MLIRPAARGDDDAIWELLSPVIRAGATLALPPDMGRHDALSYWTAASNQVFVAEREREVQGTYLLRCAQLGGGAHVANAGYVAIGGHGIGRAMCEHSIATARQAGFRAMQFNIVVSTNVRAVVLWQTMGFKEIGRVPGGFLHPTQGFVDTLIMHRNL